MRRSSGPACRGLTNIEVSAQGASLLGSRATGARCRGASTGNPAVLYVGAHRRRPLEKEIAMRRRGGPGRLIQWTVSILTVAAIVQELRKSSDEREWHGEVASFVPYDFRMPSVEKARARWWDPGGALIQPQVFGVCWTLNVGRLVAMLKGER